MSIEALAGQICWFCAARPTGDGEAPLIGADARAARRYQPLSVSVDGRRLPVAVAEIAVAASRSWRPRGACGFRGAAGPSRAVR